jgi:S-DNA-T family DNA segregation ATPase FtsK/SpoIIIE
MASGGQKSQKKSSGRSNTTRQTSKSSRTGNSGAKRSQKVARSNQIKDEIAVLLSFATAIILLLSNFELAGMVGDKIKWFMFGLFGVVAYIFPFILAGSLIFLVSNKNIIGVARIKTVAVYLLTVFLSAIIQRLYDVPEISPSSAGRFFTYSAQYKTGGGFFGGIVCKLLNPLGFWGSIVIIIILILICVIIITEKSLIRGILNMRDSGSRMVHAARQDYDIYKEHSSEKIQTKSKQGPTETEEEYLQRRRKEREEKRQEKIAKRDQMLAEKQAMHEMKLNERLNRKAVGVTNDTVLPKEEGSVDDINIHEIVVDTERHDEYSDDIYEPTGTGQPIGNYYNGESTLAEENADNAGCDATILDTDNKDEENIPADFNNQSIQNVQSEQESQLQADSAATNVQSGKETTKPQEGKSSQNSQANKAHQHKYEFPPLSLLNKNSNKKGMNQERENKATALRLQQTLQNFGVKVTITDISCGPTVTRYELQPEQGVKVSKIVSLSDDIKLNLAAADIRIEAPIPGKAAIGIEVPNKEAGSVMLRELLETDAFKNHPSPICFAAGKDIAGKTIVADIAKMPHLLIAGATGSGKSVCINTIIMSIIYRATPDDVKLIMIDPKVVELSVYNGIPHLMIPVVTDPKKASGALNWAVAEMTDRYKRFAAMNVRDLKGYNAKVSKMEFAEGEEPVEKMSQIVIIIDELADLMMVAPGEVEDAICRLAQLARAAGIHLVIATQRPSVNVITGLIKANVPSRIAFSVSSGVDSRTIIDMNGAEKLLGKGDMLFFPSGYPKPVRVQGAFVSDEEVGRVVEYLKAHMEEEVSYNEEITNTITSAQAQSVQATENERDPYFAEAGRFVIGKEKGSIGMLQRYYKIGFNRAGRIMDQLAQAGVVGPELGTKPRKVEMTLEEFEEYLKNNS